MCVNPLISSDHKEKEDNETKDDARILSCLFLAFLLHQPPQPKNDGGACQVGKHSLIDSNNQFPKFDLLQLSPALLYIYSCPAAEKRIGF
jgi:hypothetical protein